jgi:uncharacterized protein YgfB (UPF0149 family)
MDRFFCSGLLAKIFEGTEFARHGALQGVICVGVDDDTLTNLYHSFSYQLTCFGDYGITGV